MGKNIIRHIKWIECFNLYCNGWEMRYLLFILKIQRVFHFETYSSLASVESRKSESKCLVATLATRNFDTSFAVASVESRKSESECLVATLATRNFDPSFALASVESWKSESKWLVATLVTRNFESSSAVAILATRNL